MMYDVHTLLILRFRPFTHTHTHSGQRFKTCYIFHNDSYHLSFSDGMFSCVTVCQYKNNKYFKNAQQCLYMCVNNLSLNFI